MQLANSCWVGCSHCWQPADGDFRKAEPDSIKPLLANFMEECRTLLPSDSETALQGGFLNVPTDFDCS